MKKYTNIFLCSFVLFISLIFADVARSQENDAPKAKNVIYLVADGCGFNSFLAGAYWKSGDAGKQVTDKFPVLMGMTTYSITREVDPFEDHSIGYDPEKVWDESGMGFRTNTEKTVVTDSAAAGTALFTGQKTINGRVAANAAREPIKLLAEYAADRGLSSGVVTSIQISHATPATFGSHNRSRGDLPAIFNDMFDRSPLTVLMGTGHPLYKQGKLTEFVVDKDGKEVKPNYQFLGGEETWNRLQNPEADAKYIFLDKADDFRRLNQANVSIPEKVVAIVRDISPMIPKDGYLPGGSESQARRNERYPNANFDAIPTLAEMSTAAITLLSRNTKGFVLMIEGGVIDGANHRRDLELSVWETTSFYYALEAVCEWVEDFSSWDETLVIVTSDHETGNIWGPGTYEDKNNDRVFDPGEETFYGYKKLVNNGKGKLPGVQYSYGSHSNQLVPFWAKGPGAEKFEKRARNIDKKAAEHYSEFKTPANNFHGQYLDNTDIVPTLLKTMVE